jgi:hypothetical protein
MSFDEEVDAARRRLQEALREDDDNPFDSLTALKQLLPQLEAKISSRRLSFLIVEDEEEAEVFISVVHKTADEELGFIMVEDEEFVFESNLEEYFDDFVDEDPDSFVARLYETLRADLPKYEVETGR